MAAYPITTIRESCQLSKKSSKSVPATCTKLWISMAKAVVERVGNRVDVVCKQAHEIALALGIKVTQRQLLQMREEIVPDIAQHLLRCVYR